MLINHVLHANAFGLLDESNLLYPLSSPAWGDAHHFLVAQACQCNPFLILQKIHHTDPFHAPLWYPMAEMLEDWVPPKPPLGHRPGHRAVRAVRREIDRATAVPASRRAPGALA